MKKILSNQFLLLIARLVVGGVFLFFSIGKLDNPAGFAKEIGNYDFLPYFSLNFFAISIAWIELFIGLFLVLGIRVRSAAFISSALMVVFIIAIFSAMARGLNINCGCFSHQTAIVGWQKILEDFILLVLSLLIFFNTEHRISLEYYIKKEAISAS